MKTQTLSRRALERQQARYGVVPTDDPVFVAIAAYKGIEARVDYQKCRKKYESSFSWPKALAELTDAARAAFQTEPSTRAGVLAQLRFVSDYMAAFSLMREASFSIDHAVSVLECVEA